MTQTTATGTALLAYSMTTDPETVHAGASATLTIVVNAPRGNPCVVSQISVLLPVSGTDAAFNLSTEDPGISAVHVDQGWTRSGTATAGLYLLTPPADSASFGRGSLTITISSIKVIDAVGTANIKIGEWASNDATPVPDRKAKAPRSASIPVAKFPAGFKVSPLTTDDHTVATGGTTVLHWAGTGDNVADYKITYAEREVTGLPAVCDWRTPKILTTTEFVLTATTTLNGQSASLQRSVTVWVYAPEMIEFSAEPDVIDEGDEVTLNWQSAHATGVYLLAERADRQPLPAESNPDNPVTIKPVHGTRYEMVAYRDGPGKPFTSPSRELLLTYNKVDIRKFCADPAMVAGAQQSTTLSWEVLHAKSVTLQGEQVPLSGSRSESPVSDTRYTLVATGYDGTPAPARQVPVKVLPVKLDLAASQAVFTISDGVVDVTCLFLVENAAAVSVADASMQFFSPFSGQVPAEGGGRSNGIQVSDGMWRVSMRFTTGEISQPRAWLWLCYSIQGVSPIQKQIARIPWDGEAFERPINNAQ